MAKSKVKTVYTCQNCGAQRARWEGKCSDCGAWNSYVEELVAPEAKTRGWSVADSETRTVPTPLDQSPKEFKLSRASTGMDEFDRVLGGGLVQGSFVLLGGSPGIGKSTLLLQMAGGLANHQQRVLYISGEESVAQTSHRAHRLNVKSSQIQLLAESNLNQILALAKHDKPNVLIIDSIQTVYLPDLQAAPGTVSQVRECAGHLMGLAKKENMSVILIGHVTKDGNIAGPKVLEHMVDCVLSFDGDPATHFRLLRAIKNRFGAALELGVFQMNSKGLQEITNPSELFLEERGENAEGSAIFCAMEGTRPLLCEIQALTVSSPMANPRRTALGININRLHMLAAVLDRHMDQRLINHDIFVNVVGGLELEETAADLAVAAALLSTQDNFIIDSKTCLFGEIGLTGEVRGVTNTEMRLREAEKLGFAKFILPYANKKHLVDYKLNPKIEYVFLKNLKELPRALKKTKP